MTANLDDLSFVDSRTDASGVERVAVCGGGVIGLSIAVALIRRGLEVTLFESSDSLTGRAEGRTSWAAAGILPPTNLATATDPIERLRAASDNAMGPWCEWLRDQTGIDPGHQRCGGLYLAAGPAETASMIAQASDWLEAGIDCQPMRAGELAHRFEALRPWASRHRVAPDRPVAWWVVGESQVRPPRLLAALAAVVQTAGKVHLATPVVGVESLGTGVGVQTTAGRLDFDAAVLCGGAAIGRIEPALRLEQSIVPIRGQMLAMTLPQDDPLSRRPAVINVGNRYVVCRGDGQVLVGSCEEEAGWDAVTTPLILSRLQTFAVDLFPQLTADRVVDRWAALRPMTFDGFPMIGAVPQRPGIYVAGGHHRSGVHLSVATAEMIADAIQRHPAPAAPEAFAVAKQQSS